ncbi:RNase E specificity factor CsrD [Budviciaceae bacterium CWB-B4]|uniref:RNase E specificity factor CsrD n=1 Tax=Limnobaculum xujianqingii TaxID=2738837 RepID=A0A9D7FQ66_9GAMM|nr:RNase E specificity factor CsrD [Limnobaculum xujianqingii]MBK5071460.1 RNase E specificity factor CsrD [Limnobaculum xujianqingii]MBK5174769.1 RNase E specificity factor CsrD [Limnobaculum xujianqingii]
MRFTARLSIFISLLVFLTMILALMTSMLSVYFVGEEKMEKHWYALATTVDQALIYQSPSAYDRWLPVVMYATGVRHLTIKDEKDKTIYTHSSDNRPGFWEKFHTLSETDLELPQHPGYRLQILYVNPILSTLFSLPILLAIIAVIVFIGLIMFWWIHWLKQQFKGLLLLEERSQRILAGERDGAEISDEKEWPVNTSAAINRLLSELSNMSNERVRVDKLIRSFAAQDAQTGLNNRLFFDNQLATQLEEPNAHGVVMMIRLPELELMASEHGKDAIDDLLYTLVNMLSTFIMRHPAALLARYFDNDFSVMLPHRSLKEADAIAAQLVNAVDMLPVSSGIEKESLIHIGICLYHMGQTPEQIMDNAEQAARTAVLQGSNGWFIYDSQVTSAARGSVRWRTLLEQMLDKGGPDIYYKPAVTVKGELNHREMLLRIHDGSDELQPAEFMPLIQQFGLTERFDRLVLSKTLPLLDRWPNDTIAVSVTVDSLLKHSFQVWLRDNLLEKEKSYRKRIIFELAEADVCQYSDRLRPVIRLLHLLGCRLGIVQAGLMVVSTIYIKTMPIEVIKLHPGLVRNIDRRPENQLFVDSLISACEGTNVVVMAASVRTHLEWETLRSHGIGGGQGEFFASPVLIPTPKEKNSGKNRHY